MRGEGDRRWRFSAFSVCAVIVFFQFFFLFSFALCVLCVIFSLLLIKCTTSVINFASSGNCSVCYVCVCMCMCELRDDSTSNNNNNNNDDAARRWARCVTKSQLERGAVRGEEGVGRKQTKRIEIEIKIEYNKYENCTAQRRLRVKAARVAQLLCTRRDVAVAVSLPALPARCIHS